MQIDKKVFFIVGNSRSGTTMMLRILNNHPDVFVLNELHFFEQLWSSTDKDKILSQEEAENLIAKLFYIQQEGYTGEMDTNKHKSEAKTFVSNLSGTPLAPHLLYYEFMNLVTHREGKIISCEKTPQNVFYISEILDLFPQARIINMVRDPRAILLSQKRKWLRRKMGASFITKKETIRLRINYHPYTLSKLWNAAVFAAQKFDNHPQVMTVRFEDILDAPEQTMQNICQHLDIPFIKKMLDIPQASSSNEADSKESGIKKERAGNWKNGGLSPEEIAICEKTSGHLFSKYHYPFIHPQTSKLSLWWWYAIFPFKLGLALLMNLNRMKNIPETIKRRLAS
ncbi:MAG: sulfotransferase [Chitinophagales bacterium]|nr:sulfotransferase [Chitinophagales bacterium]MCZ2393217.1 sulfotransferase [Chitinophagales bacterium]